MAASWWSQRRSRISFRRGLGARPRRRWTWTAVAGCAGLAMLAAACGSSASAAVGPVYEIHAVKNSSLGTILADGKGYTVYLFEPDKQGTPTCLAGCASEWPPLMLPKGVTKPIAGPGINASLLGTVKRPGGGLQVTYNRWPLYRWIGDTSPGMTTGEGLDNLGGYWYVLNPAGDAVLGLGPRAGETSSY